MATTNTIEQDLKINLSFETEKWSKQTAKAKQDLKELNDRFKTSAKVSQKAQKRVVEFGNALKALIISQAGRSVLNTTLAFDRVANRMRSATESLDEYNEATKLASSLSDQLGVDLISASRGYATLISSTRGSGIEGEGTEKLFESILKTSSAFALTADETNSVILAFSQVASKGRAAAEEIRGQIGERIPGFFLKLADAIGVTQAELSKLLDQGLLTSDVALRASAEALDKAFGEGAQRNVGSLTAEVNRLKNEFRLLVKAIGDITLKDTNLVKDIASILKDIREIRNDEKDISDVVSDKLSGAPEVFDRISDYFKLGKFEIEGDPVGDLLKSPIDTPVPPTISELLGIDTSEIDNESKKLDEIIESNNKRKEDIKKQETTQTIGIGLTEGLRKGLKLLEDGYAVFAEKSEEAKALQDEANLAQVVAYTEILKQNLAKEKQVELDKESISNLEKQLKLLKDQEKALRAGNAGEVNFLEAIQRGSDASIRINVEARSRALGGVRDNRQLLEENLQEQKRTNELLEEVEEKLDVERV